MKRGRKPYNGLGRTDAEQQQALICELMGMDRGEIADENHAFRVMLPYQSERIRDIYARILRGEDWESIADLWHTNEETIKGYATILRNHGYKVEAPAPGWRARRRLEPRTGHTMERIMRQPELCEGVARMRREVRSGKDIKAELNLSKYEYEQICYKIAHGEFRRDSHGKG